jgi:hypothetical protein
MSEKSLLWCVIILAVLALVVGCEKPAPPAPATSTAGPTEVAEATPATATPVSTATTVATDTAAPEATDTETAMPAVTATETEMATEPTQPTETTMPTDTVMPTDTPAATATAPVQVTLGKTYIAVAGHLAAKGSQRFTVQASEGQWLIANVEAPADNVYLAVTGADGTVLADLAEEASHWRGRVPATQSYAIQVAASDAASDFELGVVLPQRIQFEPGETSALLEGSLEPGFQYHYVLRAQAGQRLLADLGPDAGAFLTLEGLDDGRDFLTADAEAFEWQGTLPATQDYLLTVTALSDAVDYRLNVVIPETIHFLPGGTSIRLEGDLAAGETHDYVLVAEAGQFMRVNVDASGDVDLAIYGLSDEDLLIHPSAETPSWQGVLTLTQDYLISVAAGTEATDYTLHIIIPERISFTPNATSAQLEGELGVHQTHEYVLNAQAGQWLLADVQAPDGAYLTIYGLEDGIPLIHSSSEIPHWEGKLLRTQDYMVIVGAGPEATSYTLDVIIPQRLFFPPGETALTFEDQLPAQAVKHYVLRASEDQAMRVEITAASDELSLGIAGLETGIPLATFAEDENAWEGVLLSTQDYMIKVTGPHPATDYALQISIR